MFRQTALRLFLGLAVSGLALTAATGGRAGARPGGPRAPRRRDRRAVAHRGQCRARPLPPPAGNARLLRRAAADTVVEIWPGGGWYTEILAPYLRRGGGTYYAASHGRERP